MPSLSRGFALGALLAGCVADGESPFESRCPAPRATVAFAAGQVRDAGGQPVADAQVRALALLEGSGGIPVVLGQCAGRQVGVGHAESASDGAFTIRLSGITPTRACLAVEAITAGGLASGVTSGDSVTMRLDLGPACSEPPDTARVVVIVEQG